MCNEYRGRLGAPRIGRRLDDVFGHFRYTNIQPQCSHNKHNIYHSVHDTVGLEDPLEVYRSLVCVISNVNPAGFLSNLRPSLTH